jgi:hypothetical protein
MWILHMEQTDDCTIMHDRNVREFRLPEFPRYSVDSYCAETKTVYEFWDVFSTVVIVNRFVTTQHYVQIHWLNAMKGQFRESNK